MPSTSRQSAASLMLSSADTSRPVAAEDWPLSTHATPLTTGIGPVGGVSSSSSTGIVAGRWPMEEDVLDLDIGTLRRNVLAQQEKYIPPAPRTTVLRVPEVMDDFIRNFLHRNEMQETLQAFEAEWYQRVGSRVSPSTPMVPDNYRETAALLNRIDVLERDLRQHAELTTRLTQQWAQAKKDREYHRLSHQRVVQENARLSKLLRQAGQHADNVNPTLTDMRQRCEQLLKSKSLLTIERDRLAQEVEQLREQVKEVERHAEEEVAAATAATVSGRTSAEEVSGGGTKLQRKEKGKGRRLQPIPGGAAKSGPAGPVGTTRGTPRGTANWKADSTDFSWPADERPRSTSPSQASDALLVHGNSPTDWVEQMSFVAHAMPVASVSLHPFKPVVASGCDDGSWRLSTLPDGSAVVSGQGHRNWISSIDVYPDGTMLATGSGDKTIKLWDFSTNTCAGTLCSHTDGVWDVRFQETGVLLASGGLDKTARVWDVANGVCRQTLRGHTDAVNAVCWMPATNLLLTGSADKAISVWDARVNSRVQTFNGHRAAVLSVATVPSGDVFASCDTEGAVLLWDARRMEQVLHVACGPKPCNAVSLDRTGQFIAVASDDGTVKVVDVQEGVVTELVGHDGPVQSVKFDPATNHFLVSGGSDRTIRYWC